MAANKGNLKQGAKGKEKAKRTKDDDKAYKKLQKFAQTLLDNPKYQATLKQKMEDGTCHPSIQTTLMYYAGGKPRETEVEKPPVPVQIVMEFDPAVNKEPK